jgi:hypothetical protein
VTAFAAAYGAKFPKAAAKVTQDEDELPASCDYPAQHRVHLRTTNPIWVNRSWRPEPGQRRAPAAPATTYAATRPGQARGQWH